MKKVLLFVVVCAVIGIILSGCPNMSLTNGANYPTLEVGKEYHFYYDYLGSHAGIVESQSGAWITTTEKSYINLNQIAYIRPDSVR